MNGIARVGATLLGAAAAGALLWLAAQNALATALPDAWVSSNSGTTHHLTRSLA